MGIEQKIILIQEKMMEEYKWIESEKAGHDLGNCCCLEWIKKFANAVRNELNNLSEDEINKLFNESVHA